eukprot:1333873-Pyramimonas_sp.AAC.1
MFTSTQWGNTSDTFAAMALESFASVPMSVVNDTIRCVRRWHDTQSVAERRKECMIACILSCTLVAWLPNPTA